MKKISVWTAFLIAVLLCLATFMTTYTLVRRSTVPNTGLTDGIGISQNTSKEYSEFVTKLADKISEVDEVATNVAAISQEQAASSQEILASSETMVEQAEKLSENSQEIADALARDYKIATRGGLHCAPLCHNFLGTSRTGLVRISVSGENTQEEAYAFLNAMEQIVKKI